jgi:hypothetical protein
LNKTHEMISKYSMMLSKVSEETKVNDLDELTNDDPDSIYGGKKNRRRNSLHKIFGFADYLNFEENPKIKQFLETSQEHLIFSSDILEYNEKLKSISKCLVLTEKCIYIFDSKHKVSQEIKILDLVNVSVSTLTDNFILFNSCILFECEKKTEVLTILSRSKQNLEKELKIEVMNK